MKNIEGKKMTSFVSDNTKTAVLVLSLTKEVIFFPSIFFTLIVIVELFLLKLCSTETRFS